MDTREEDFLKARFYREFYDANRDLYKKNHPEYYIQQTIYVTKKMSEVRTTEIREEKKR